MVQQEAEIGIVGAGISGLALGRCLTMKAAPYFLLEAGLRPGGVIQTVEIEDGKYQLNYGANTLFVDDADMDFLQDSGLGPDWIEPAKVGDNRFILRGQSYKALPSSPIRLLFSDFFSMAAKWKILSELKYTGQGDDNDTVAAFFTRHFGAEVVANAVQPFVAGIYAGDAHQLLMRHAFPKLQAIEAEHGSILKGLKKAGSAKGKRRKSISFLKGMGTMIDALYHMNTNVQLGQSIEKISRDSDGRFCLETKDGKLFTCKKLVLTLPAYSAAALLQPVHPAASGVFAGIHYPAVAQLHFAFKRADVGFHLRGFGGLHPPNAGTFTSGAIWLSSLFPLRCPPTEVLLCVFVGGVGRPSIADMGEADILKKAVEEIGRIYEISGAPTMQHIRLWPRAIPQYDSGLNGVAEAAADLEKDNIFILANWLGGVSVQDCIKKAIALSEKL